jgi:hypothetical protein
MAKHDDFIDGELAGILEEGETVLHKAHIIKAPGILMQALLMGPLLSFLMTKAYFAAWTNKRLIIITTKKGFFGPKNLNLGVESIPAGDIQEVKTSGLLNNRSMTFIIDGKKRTWRIAPWYKGVTGQGDFFKQVPALASGKQLNA